MTDVTLPAHLHRLVVLSLKQYALMLGAMKDSASSPESARTFAKECRGVIDLTRMVEDCATLLPRPSR